MLDVPFPFRTNFLTGTYFLISLWYESITESAASGYTLLCVFVMPVYASSALCTCGAGCAAVCLPEEGLIGHGSMVKSSVSTALEHKLPSADPC